MKSTCFSERISKTGNLDVILITRHFELDLKARFVEIKSINRRLRQDGISKKLGCSSSTLQRYRQVINMISPYGIPPNTNKRKQKTSNANIDDVKVTSNDLKMTSKDLKTTSSESFKPKENKLKGGAIEHNEKSLDEVIHIITIWTLICVFLLFLFILFHKYSADNLQNSICTFIITIIPLFVFEYFSKIVFVHL